MIVKQIKQSTAKKLIGGTLPDIDTDFPSKARGYIKQYIEERFGVTQVCSVGVYTTMKPKSVIKDLGKALSVNFTLTNLVTSILDGGYGGDETLVDVFKKCTTEPVLKDFIMQNSDIFYMLPTLLDQPRNKSVHPCAMIVFPEVLEAIEWAPMRKVGDLLISEWRGGELDDAGFLKDDILGILQLDKFQEILDLIKKRTGEEWDVFNLPDDPEVYRYFANGWNGDTFQFASAGLTEYGKQLKPKTIEDLVAAIALFRPGPMDNGYHTDYVKRKNEGEEVQYLWGTEEITAETYGLLVYQEQIMQTCQLVGGLTLEESDDVRRSMGKRDVTAIQGWRSKVREGFMQKGCPSEEAFNEVWEAMLKFARYAFNKCLSGDEKLLRASNSSGFKPTIGEMYKIKNDPEYAKSVGKRELHSKYKYQGFGKTYSMQGDNKLRLNSIVDIRFEGTRPVFEITLSNEKKIKTTHNHKFPTNKGEKMVMQLRVGDLLYHNEGYKQDTWMPGITMGDSKLNSKPGHRGFTKREVPTEHLKLKYYKNNLKKDYCEICKTDSKRLEVHHKDGNHFTNNEPKNLQTVCCSCHKKEHYKLGRTKAGQKGFGTNLYSISSIKLVGEEEVYDVEMAAPYHNFVTDQGVVTCNSHSASYGKTSYASQWLKVNYPLEYWTIALTYSDEKNSLQMLSEIFRAKTISVKAPDLNHSSLNMTSGVDTIYWGIQSIKGVGEKTALQIIEEREKNGPYTSLTDFIIRHSYKGSTVKKQTFEALIACGAFDSLYNIGSIVAKRNSLLTRFRLFKKVKVSNPKTDLYKNGQVWEDWWWQLRQKDLTKLVEIDYKNLYNESEVSTCKFMSERESQMQHQKPIERGFAGYVIELQERTGKKGKYARILIESGYKPFTIMVWTEQYLKIRDELKGCEKGILVFNGLVQYDGRYSKANQFTLTKNSNIKILK